MTELANIEMVLESLRERYDRLDAGPVPPRLLLRIIGASRDERVWHDLLAYFLDGDAPHGFGTSVLAIVLEELEPHLDTSLGHSQATLDDVEVLVEPWAKGYPDLVVLHPGEWFVYIELKIDAGESDSQTERYVAADAFGEYEKDDIPEERHHYLYVSPGGTSQPVDAAFERMSWEALVRALDRLFARDLARYPQRSVAQYRELVQTIRTETHMTTDEDTTWEKAALYDEHRELWSDLSDAVEEAAVDYQAGWLSRFEADPQGGPTNGSSTVTTRSTGDCASVTGC